ncbi:MAG: hypothetical protein R3D30_05135 [Hyphomicrobiales bacterium]
MKPLGLSLLCAVYFPTVDQPTFARADQLAPTNALMSAPAILRPPEHLFCSKSAGLSLLLKRSLGGERNRSLEKRF